MYSDQVSDLILLILLIFYSKIANKYNVNKVEKEFLFPLWWRKIKFISAETQEMLKISATCLFRRHSGKYF
jgi:hypothetical protein